MLDLKETHKNYKYIKTNLKQRGYILDVNLIRKTVTLKKLKTNLENINARLNNNKALNNDKADYKHIKANIDLLETEINQVAHMIPNILHHTVPFGVDATDNIVIKENLITNNTNEGYLDIAEKNGLNIQAGVKLAGTRFNTMNGKVAKLHRKLLNLALDHYEQANYEYHYVPNLVNKETMFGTGQYPKFKEDLFETTTGLYLIPTGEVPLTNLFTDITLTEKNANQKLVTNTPCFRKEVGAYGKDTKGIIRQHQFEKVELVRTCLPELGLTTFLEMVNDIETFVKTLYLDYRIIELCTKDIGFAGHKAYDFEIWFPHEKQWREIATVTWCHNFQARRMNAKVKRNGKKELIHTLNGTGLAVGRVLAGLLEQHGEKAFDLFNV